MAILSTGMCNQFSGSDFKYLDYDIMLSLVSLPVITTAKDLWLLGYEKPEVYFVEVKIDDLELKIIMVSIICWMILKR